jgi:CheY-like chemotaxis protein
MFLTSWAINIAPLPGLKTNSSDIELTFAYIANRWPWSRGGLLVAVVGRAVEWNLMSKRLWNEVMEKIQVLIIEDDPSVADALKLIMEDSGYETVIAINARQGLEQAGLRRFDLTITDVQLPDKSGLDVLAVLRKKEPAIPVIVITAHFGPEVIAEAMARGACQVLPKPFLPAEILDIARIVVAKKMPTGTGPTVEPRCSE